MARLIVFFILIFALAAPDASPDARDREQLSTLEGDWGVTADFRANHDFPGISELACDAFPRRIAVRESDADLALLEISAGNVPAPVSAAVKRIEEREEGLLVTTEIGERPVRYVLRKDGRLLVFYTPPGTDRPMPGLPLERCQPKAFY